MPQKMYRWRPLAVRVLSAILLLTLAVGPSLAAAQHKKGAQKEATPQPKYKVGDVAPDFSLEDQNGKDVSLHDFRGKKTVALAFFVFAFTGG
jgi:cytochrome oxidase Cu insertion factor (SCO1/SenC/PrrC family)